jgi:CheY-like chemotaxis protein
MSVPPGLRVRGDPVRLAQLVSNLLNNAAKYTRVGGRVALDVRQEDALVVLRVTDNGEGIPRDMLDRVFDRFVQVGSADRAAAGGLGLGLTLVKQLVEMHGGTVEARSDGPERGSEFVVRLPALPATATGRSVPGEVSGAGAAADPYLLTGAPARRILVVDDIVDAAEAVARMLALDGHDVRVVHDGLAALDAAERLEPEIVLLDIGLPKVDGLEVARRLRSRFGPDAMLLVATTGLGQDADRRRTSEAGFDHHLVKPIDPDILRRLVASDQTVRRG